MGNVVVYIHSLLCRYSFFTLESGVSTESLVETSFPGDKQMWKGRVTGTQRVLVSPYGPCVTSCN